MFFALCVTVLNDVDTLSPSADVRINLPKRQLFDFVFALTEFPKQLGVVGRITLVRGHSGS